MNKKITFSILLILLITTLCLGAISAADSNGVKFKSDDGFKLNIPKNEDYTIYKVENINFKIPLSLINNTYIINSSNDYISINNFSSLSDVDIWPTDNDILSYEYGETASGSEIQDVENKMIGNHPVSILILNDERIYYFQTSDKNTVYRIEYSYYNNRFDKNVEKSIEKIIETSPNSTIDNETFFKRLDSSVKEASSGGNGYKNYQNLVKTNYNIDNGNVERNADDSSTWKKVIVGDTQFRIPPKYEKAILSSSTYLVIDNVYTFAIRDIDSYEFLKDSYGDDATSKYTVYDENKTISDHPAAIIYQEVSINQMDGTGYKTYDVVEVYFQTGDSIYCISYNGTKVTSDVEEMIKHTPKPSDSSDMFYEKLGRARDNYIKEYDEESEDYLYDLIDENTRTTRDKRGFYW